MGRMGIGNNLVVFPDSAFLVAGLAIMSVLQIVKLPLADGLSSYLPTGGQFGISICFLVGSVVCLIGLAVIRREALAGGWIQAGGLLGIEIGLGIYTYLLATHIDAWYLTPTAWLLFGLMAMFASRCARVVLFTRAAFRQARQELKQERRRP